MKTSIFIKSYLGDAQWLEYLLRSIKKFGSGYHEVLVVSEDDLGPMVDKYGFSFEPCKQPDYDGYMYQQFIKMIADSFFDDTDWILFVDSNCVFTGPNTPETWMKDGKPYMYYLPWDKMENQKIWQAPTENAIQLPWNYDVTHNVMVYSPNHVASTRSRIESIHNESIHSYIRRNTVGRTFSEYNAIGTWCRHAFPGDFVYVDKSGSDKPCFPVKCWWSWGGVTEKIKEEIESHLA